MDQWVYLAAGLLAFWSAVMLAKQFLPKSFEVHPFLVMWKTTKFNDFIDRLGRKLGRFWKILWTFGIALGFGAMAYITFILGRNLYYIFFSTESASPVSLIIPGITLSLNFNTLFFFGVSIAIILVTHELAHGVAARAERSRSNTGLLLMVLMPGAVEADGKGLNKARGAGEGLRRIGDEHLVGLLAPLFYNAGALIRPCCDHWRAHHRGRRRHPPRDPTTGTRSPAQTALPSGHKLWPRSPTPRCRTTNTHGCHKGGR